MFKRSNRAKMLALVASLGTVGSNINSNAGAANANNAGSSLSEKILTGVGGFALGATTLALLAKFTGLGSKLVGTGSLKADKTVLVKFLKCLISNNKLSGLEFKIDNGNVIVEKLSDLGVLDLDQKTVKQLENNDNLKDDALFAARKKWSALVADGCMASLIEARKLADLKHPTKGYKYGVDVRIDDGKILCDIDGVKINKENDAMDNVAKQINDFIKKVEDTVKEFTIVQAFKEAKLELEKEAAKGKE